MKQKRMEDSVPGNFHNETNVKSDSNNKKDSKNKEKGSRKNMCGPCKEDDKEELAEGFCIDCQDYLCENCFKYHCIPKPTKYHRVLDKDDMPKRKVERDLSNVCPKHKGEIMKHYCKDHDVIGCYSCIYPEHNSCAGTCLLEDAAYGIETSTMYKDFFTKVSELEKEFGKQLERAQQNNLNTYNCHSTALASMKAVHKKINDHFEKLETDIAQKALQIYSEDTRKCNNIKETSKAAVKEMNHLKEDLKLLEETKQGKQLFTVINKEKQNQNVLEERIKHLKLDNNVRRYKFIPNLNLEMLIKDINSLGILSVQK